VWGGPLFFALSEFFFAKTIRARFFFFFRANNTGPHPFAALPLSLSPGGLLRYTLSKQHKTP
jgi:hypothetical protein